MTLQVAIEALRADAEVWDGVAAVVGRAGQEAGSLGLGESELSWAANPTGLITTYAEIQQKAARLLGEGAQALGRLGAALDSVAMAYERDDEDAARRLKGTWDVRP